MHNIVSYSTSIVSFIVVIVIVPLSAAQLVMLQSAIENGSEVCSGEEIQIKCTTTGSSIQTWHSDAFIGSHPGASIEVIYNPDAQSMNNTDINFFFTGNVSEFFVELSSSGTQVDGVIELQSILHVVASTTYPNPVVTCSNAAHSQFENSSDSITFTVMGKPDAVLDVTAIQVMITNQSNSAAAMTCILSLSCRLLFHTDEISSSTDISYELTVNSTTLSTPFKECLAAINVPCGRQNVTIRADIGHCYSPVLSKNVTEVIQVINFSTNTVTVNSASTFTFKPIAIIVVLSLVSVIVSYDMHA